MHETKKRIMVKKNYPYCIIFIVSMGVLLALTYKLTACFYVTLLANFTVPS